MPTRATTLSLTAFITTVCALSAHARVENVVQEGDQPPGTPPGAQFASFSVPLLNNDSLVTFRAFLETGPGGVTLDDNLGIWSGSTVSPSLIARRGTTNVDDIPGALFSSLSNNNNNSSSTIAINATLDIGPGGVTAADNAAIFKATSASNELIAREGDPAPGPGPAGNFQLFFANRFSENGSVAFVANLDSSNDTNNGIWSGTGGALTQIARDGQPAPDTLGALFGSTSTQTFLTPAINDDGDITYSAQLALGGPVTSDNDQGIWQHTGSHNLVVREGAFAPGTPAGVLFGDGSARPHVTTNNNDQITFKWRVNGPGVDSTNNDGIWQQSTPGNFDLVAREGDPAPDTPAGTTFKTINTAGAPALSTDNHIAFAAELQGPGIGPDNNEAIWLGNPGSLKIAARAGDHAPGTPPGAVFRSFGDPAINNANQIAFNAGLKLNPPVVTEFTGLGLWLADQTEQILVARTGDTVDGKTINHISYNLGTSTQAGQPQSFNDYAQLIYTLYFEDDSSGIYLYTPDLHWRRSNPTGNWDDKDNWTIGTKPAHVHDLTIAPDTDLYVTGPSENATPESLTIGDGAGLATLHINAVTVTPQSPLAINRNAHLQANNAATINPPSTNMGNTTAFPTDAPATLSIAGTGSNFTTGTFKIANNSPATANITDNATATIDTLDLGIASHGTLNILAGATATVDDVATLGNTNNGTGTLNIDGPGSSFSSPNEMALGNQGHAHLNITNQGSLHSDVGFYFANQTESNTTLNVQGPATTVTTDDTEFAVKGHTTATIQDNATFTTNTLRVAASGTADLTLRSAATLTTNSSTFLAFSPGAIANMLVTDPATTFNPASLRIGSAGHATLTIQNAATTNVSGSTIIASSSTATGTLNLTDPGTTYNTAAFNAAEKGTAIVNISNGATLNATSANLADSTGSTATINITDPGSSMNLTGTLDLGDSGGTANIYIQNNATLNNPDNDTNILATSAIHINGGTFNAHVINGPGKVHINTGTLHIPNAASFSINPSVFDDNLTLNTNAAITSPNNLVVDASMNLNLRGGTLDADEILNNGNINHTTGTIIASTFNNDNDMNLGSTTNALIDAPTSNNNTTATITGPGTFTGNLNNAGRVNLTGQTLRVLGNFNNDADALIIGNGTLQADTINNDADMAFSGPTNIIGDLTNNPTGLIVSTGPGPLTFFDDVNNDGQIRTNTGGFTVFLGTTSGSGSYTGTGTVVYEADFTPGSSPGINSFAGNLTFGPFASLELEAQATVTSPVAGTDHDQLTIANTLTLDGTLNVTPLPDTGPIENTPLGNNYLAITYGTRTPGSFFQTINGTLINTAFALAPLLNETTNTLQLRATIPGDLNLDNKVSVADLAEFALNFDTTPGLYNDATNTNSWQLGDFNTDGAITVADLSLLALNFGFDASDPSSSPLALTPDELAAMFPTFDLPADLSPAPEPATITLLTCFALLSTRRQRPQ